jgi:hypothetical protein
MMAPASVPAWGQQSAPPAGSQPKTAAHGPSLYTFKVTSELVLVSVSARGKNGELVRDLKQGDFTVMEDGKPQKVVTFDIENTQNVAQSPVEGPAQADIAGAAALKTAALTAPRVSRATTFATAA